MEGGGVRLKLGLWWGAVLKNELHSQGWPLSPSEFCLF